MSSDWKECELGEVIELLTAKVNSDSVNLQNYVSTENILSERGGIKEASGLPKQTKYLGFIKGDVLFSNIRTYFKKVWEASFEGGASNDVIVFRTKDNSVLDQSFVYSLISDEKFIDYTVVTAKGTKMPRGDKDAIRGYNVKFPSDIEKQKEIALIHKNLNDKIANNNLINKTLEEMAQALFKSWFVDFEPVKAKVKAIAQGTDPKIACMETISGKKADETQGFASKQYDELRATADLFPDNLEESELGLIPEGWSLKPLYETAEYVNGSSFKSKDFTSDKSGLPIIKIAELKSGIAEQTKYTNVDMPEKYRISNNDMLYSWSGSPETSLEVFKWFGGEGWLNQHIFKINTETIEQKVFVYFLLKHLKPELIATAKNKQTTGLGHITVADMKRMKVVMPSKESNPLITRYLISLFDKASNCQKENSVLVKQRDTLLPKLLSGELNI